MPVSRLHAAARPYMLNGEASKVGFIWKLGQDEVEGQMPVARANLLLDFADIRQSSVEVELDAANVRAGFVFATQAMKGPKMLDTNEHPAIRFTSNSVRKSGNGARIDGQITIRDITRPLQLDAQLFRPVGSDPDDLRQLRIRLTGTINRAEFGATGWSNLVADEVKLNIDARVQLSK